MESKEVSSWQEDRALERYQMIAPLLDPSLDDAAKLAKREAIAEENDLSVRTLYRYEEQYRNNGFSGLKPSDRTMRLSPKLPPNYDELVAEAIQLKKEVPKRSVEAHPLEIKKYCGKSPAIPVSMQPVEPATSRLRKVNTDPEVCGISFQRRLHLHVSVRFEADTALALQGNAGPARTGGTLLSW